MTYEKLNDTFSILEKNINKLYKLKNNRIKFDYGATEKAPKFDLVIEQEHNYYMQCPVCDRSSELKSSKALNRFECKHCEAEFMIDGQMLFDGQSKCFYPF